ERGGARGGGGLDLLWGGGGGVGGGSAGGVEAGGRLLRPPVWPPGRGRRWRPRGEDLCPAPERCRPIQRRGHAMPLRLIVTYGRELSLEPQQVRALAGIQTGVLGLWSAFARRGVAVCLFRPYP